MSTGTRAPGWYPDPWGTGEERYFDGVAWARSTRRPGDLTAPVPGAPAAAPPATDTAAATSGWTGARADQPAAPEAAPEAAPAPPAVPPGWYQDPWGRAPFRYWDGAQWTGHVSGPSSAPAAGPRLEDERAAGRWAKLGLAWGGPALAVSAVAGAFQWHWIAEHWDELTTPGREIQQTGNNGAAIAYQLGGLVVLVAGVFFLLWFHRAASNAVSAGMPGRRGPVLATFSFIIPILNLWWPYQSACDLLPPAHPGRLAIRRWWALWIGFLISWWAIVAAAMTLNDIALAITTAVGVVLALLAAFAARAVVDEISDAHGQMLARAV